jgi:hypothetical protein
MPVTRPSAPASPSNWNKDEAIYGLGILQNGQMNQRNQEVRMVQNNTWDFVTFFQSVKVTACFGIIIPPPPSKTTLKARHSPLR